MTIGVFAESVREFCALTGGSITSWIRSQTHNTAVGGVPQSAHRYGLGADVVYDQAQDAIVATDTAKRLGLRLIREGDHDHLQPIDWMAG